MPVILYSVLRLGLFTLALVSLGLAGMGGWLLVLVAALVAWAVSYAVLGARRDAAALWIAEHRGAVRPRFGAGVESDTAAEDAAAEHAATVEPATADPHDPPNASDR